MHVTVDKKVERLGARGIPLFGITCKQIVGPTEHPTKGAVNSYCWISWSKREDDRSHAYCFTPQRTSCPQGVCLRHKPNFTFYTT
jgi:hypothetical protein